MRASQWVDPSPLETHKVKGILQKSKATGGKYNGYVILNFVGSLQAKIGHNGINTYDTAAFTGTQGQGHAIKVKGHRTIIACSGTPTSHGYSTYTHWLRSLLIGQRTKIPCPCMSTTHG